MKVHVILKNHVHFCCKSKKRNNFAIENLGHMRKTFLTHILMPAFLVILVSGCTGRKQYRTLLARADSLMIVQPNSAHALLCSIDSADLQRQRKSVRMRYELLRAEAQNKLLTPFTTDSLLREVADYYNSTWHKYILHSSFFMFHFSFGLE